MISPVNALLLLWLALTVIMMVMWLVLRRRRARSEAAADAESGTPANVPLDVPHPALAGGSADGDVEGADADTVPGTVTTDTVDIGDPVGVETVELVSATGDDPVDVDPFATETADLDHSADGETVVLGDSVGINTEDLQATVELDNPVGIRTEDLQATVELDNPSIDTQTSISATTTQEQAVPEKPSTLNDLAVAAAAGSAAADQSGLATATARTLTDMLDGVRLPYDLTPVTSMVEDPDRHLVFLTTHSNATEVGTKFANELDRLGFEFEPVGLDKAVAVRGADVISMTIVPQANEVENGTGPRYGAAGPGDVALELWVGRSNTPPIAGIGSN